MCPTEDNIESCIAPMQGFAIPSLNMDIPHKECIIRNRNVLARRFIPEDEDNVVSLDPPPKVILDHWNINIVKMFSEKKQALLSAKFLMEIVASYKLSLRNKALFYAYSERLSSCIIHHLNFIHESFHDLEYHRISLPEATNYFSMLEDVLAVYCSVHLKTISKTCFKPDSNNNRECDRIIITDETLYHKRMGKYAQKLAFVLHNFLHRNENVLHVLMKMWFNRESLSCMHTMRYLYTLLLHEKPVIDKSDESYCRYVISYLLWMLVEKKDGSNDTKDSMIGVLNKKFGYVNNEIPDSPFIKKVLGLSGNQMDFVNMIQLRSNTIERYFLEVKKNQQRRMFQDDFSVDSRPYESFLFDVNDDKEINIGEPDLYPESEISDADSDVVEIIVLDSDDEDDVQVISNSNTKVSNRTDLLPRDKAPILHLNTPLLSGTMTTKTARNKVQRTAQRCTPHLDSITQSVLQTMAEVVRKAQSSNSEQSVCLNSDSVTDTYSDISERFAVKRAQVRSRARPSVDVNSTSENLQNPYMSPPSSSIGTPDNNYPETVELEAHSPGIKCSTSAGVGGGHASSTNAANLLLYTPDSQDERADQSFELQPRTPTDSEERDANSGLDEDHDTGQEPRKRREPLQMDNSRTLTKRRRVNGDISSILLSPACLPPTLKDISDTVESKNTSTTGIPFTTSVSKRRCRNNSDEDPPPWERHEREKSDTFSNLDNERLKDSNITATKPSSQSTQPTVPDQIHPTILPSILPKVITLNKVPPVELNETEYTSEIGVKGLLGSDVALLSQLAIEIVQSMEITHVAVETTHTEYVRDKGFVQVVNQPEIDIVENIICAVRTATRSRGQVDVDTEDGDGRRKNITPNKDILKEACADLLLPDADQDETIGTTSSNHVNSLTHLPIVTNELANNLDVAPTSPASTSSATYPLDEFDKFEQQHQNSLSDTNSCAGSVVGDEPVSLPNGFVSPVLNRDKGDRNSVHSFNSSYQAEEPPDEDNIVSTSPMITAKKKHHMSKGISTLVSSSSTDSSNAAATKNFYGSQSLKDYIKTKPAYVDLSLRKRCNNKMPEMGRKRPNYNRDYTFPTSSPSVHISEVFDDDTNLYGSVGIDLRLIPIDRPTMPTKGNISYTPFPFEYSRHTENNTITESLSLLYASNNSFSSETSANDSILEVSYAVSNSNNSVCTNKVTPSLTIAVDVPKPEDLELEFSNSPTIFEDTTKGLLERMALQTDTPEDNVIIVADSNMFLANNTNYYLLSNPTSYCSSTISNACPTNVNPSIPVPTQIVTNTDHSINAITATPATPITSLEELTPEEEEALNKLLQESMAHMNNTDYESNGTETRLPFKKRRVSVGSKIPVVGPSYQQQKRKQRHSNNSKQLKSSTCKEQLPIPQTEISYPATKMISIAEVQEQSGRRSVKTAAERKEMPLNVSANITPAATAALTNDLPFTPFYPCNGDRVGTVLNIPSPQSYNRNSFVYPYGVSVLSAALPPATQAQASVASAYYSSLLTPQQYASSMVSTSGITPISTELAAVGTNYACHHRLSGSVMAAATLAATTASQTYKPQQRRRSAVSAKRDMITAARTRPTSVQYK